MAGTTSLLSAPASLTHARENVFRAQDRVRSRHQMRVAFNATALLSPVTGIGRYTREVAIGLQRVPGVQARYFCGLRWSSEVPPEPSARGVRLLPWLRQHIPFSYQVRLIVQAQRFTAGTRIQGSDLYHEPNFLPLPFDGPLVLTVHDLSWIRHPDMHPAERVRAMNRYFEPGVKRASHIITDSAFVKQELIDTFGLPEGKITAIPLGVSPAFRPMDEQETLPLLQRYGLRHGAYWLTVGTLEPRKNLVTALRAQQQLAEADDRAFPLVVAGMKGWATDALEREMAPLETQGRVIRLDYVARGDLPALMAAAKALIYPSLYEGFGLPPLEAMACGVPVIASNRSALPEVVGQTGVLFDPEDVQALQRAMRFLAKNPEHATRLGAAAKNRARSFTWERCVDATVAVYRQVLA